jgi:tungstate transport system substrate-binding protein
MNKKIVLATTTSTEASGLLNVLIPAFTKKTGIEVEPLVLGTGKALETARLGNADVVMVHSPKDEDKFVADGFGIERRGFMKNDFVIVGPVADPAGIKGMTDAAEAFKKIYSSADTFISRGDKSGTEVKEQDIWTKANINPRICDADTAFLYISAGQSMGETIIMANEKSAYTLADRATWLGFRKKVALVLLVENDPILDNPYSIIVVNPKKHPHVNSTGANAFADWLCSSEGQDVINSFKIDGTQVFFGTVGK